MQVKARRAISAPRLFHFWELLRMTQVLVLKNFRGKHGEFNPGPEPVHLESNYAQECMKNGLVKLFVKLEPQRRQAMPGAPSEKKPGESTKPLGDGRAQSPQSLRVARASAKKTSKRSVSGVTAN
jgi:hypothetical protein